MGVAKHYVGWNEFTGMWRVSDSSGFAVASFYSWLNAVRFADHWSRSRNPDFNASELYALAGPEWG